MIPDQLELKRAKDRERINRLRADPAYREAENEIERERDKARRRNDPAYAALRRQWKRESDARRRAAVKIDDALRVAAE